MALLLTTNSICASLRFFKFLKLHLLTYSRNHRFNRFIALKQQKYKQKFIKKVMIE